MKKKSMNIKKFIGKTINKQELLKQDLVYGIGQNLNNKKNITNSLLVAEKFQKQHKHVLEDIKKILEDGRNLGNPFYCKKKELYFL